MGDRVKRMISERRMITNSNTSSVFYEIKRMILNSLRMGNEEHNVRSYLYTSTM